MLQPMKYLPFQLAEAWTRAREALSYRLLWWYPSLNWTELLEIKDPYVLCSFLMC